MFALDNAKPPKDMNAPGWGLHALPGELEGHWSVEVSGNWRLTFTFEARTPCSWIITTITEVFLMRMHDPPHPGEVLRDYLGSMSVTEAAKHLGVTRASLSRILNGSTGISAEMALRRSEALGTNPELWFGMQAQYELWHASRRHRTKVPRLVMAARFER